MTDDKEREKEKTRMIMPLVSRSFAPGKAKELIESIEDEDERRMAQAEYYQYTGKAKKAVAIAKEFINHKDPIMRISAHIVLFISGLGSGDAVCARDSLKALDTFENEGGVGSYASGSFCANMIKIMMFFKENEFRREEDIPADLPEGAKFHATYFLALREYLLEEYDKAVGMANAALLIGGGRYPIPAIYLHIIAASSLVRIKCHEEAERHFCLALQAALPDGFIAPFGQQYVMLAGLNKKCIKAKEPSKYKEVSRYADTFIPTWIDAHNGMVKWYANHGLTKMEHVAAALFKGGFSIKEVAFCMSISVNTVKRHISMAYQKMNVKKREGLFKYIIR